MRKFQSLLFVLKQSYICYYIICMTVPLKSLKFKLNKENYFQTHAAGFIRLPYLLEKGEKYQRNLHLIIRLRLDNYW